MNLLQGLIVLPCLVKLLSFPKGRRALSLLALSYFPLVIASLTSWIFLGQVPAHTGLTTSLG